MGYSKHIKSTVKCPVCGSSMWIFVYHHKRDIFGLTWNAHAHCINFFAEDHALEVNGHGKTRRKAIANAVAEIKNAPGFKSTRTCAICGKDMENGYKGSPLCLGPLPHQNKCTHSVSYRPHKKVEEEEK